MACFFIVDNESMFTISEDTVGVMHESPVISKVPEEMLDMVDGPEVGHDFNIYTPDLEVAHASSRCGPDSQSWSVWLRAAVSSWKKRFSPVVASAMSCGLQGGEGRFLLWTLIFAHSLFNGQV